MTVIVPYSGAHREAWNALNAEARNGHFLFDRDYMEYHASRFVDASCILLHEGEPLALLPANIVGDTVYSHQGLTFGGFILSDRANSLRVLNMFHTLIVHLREQGHRRLIYKPAPFIYHRRPAQEDLYALFRQEARVVRRDVTTTIDYRDPGRFSRRRRRGVSKAGKAGLEFEHSSEWQQFWDILAETLAYRHGAVPTHTLAEIELLASRFPSSIRLYTAGIGGRVVAGVAMYESSIVAHAQYIAANDEGRRTGALDGLFDFLIAKYSTTHRFFDFGISNEDGGRVLNEGLVTQKEEFGGSAVIHEVYELNF